MDTRIERVLLTLFGEAGRRARVAPLTGGITNHSFAATVGERRVVVRLAGANTEALGIDRQAERDTAAIVAAAGLGPALLHSDPDAGVMVTGWLDGTTLTPEAVRAPATFARVVRAIAALHALPAIAGGFSAFATVRGYHRLALARGVALPPASADGLALLARIEASLPPAPPRPCHNDLLAANLIDDGRRIWLIDWEYAGMGDPFFDLGNFAANLELSATDSLELLRIYGSPHELARLERMRVVSDLREAFWGFVQAGVSRLDHDFLGYGEKHLRRALAAP